MNRVILKTDHCIEGGLLFCDGNELGNFYFVIILYELYLLIEYKYHW